MIFKLKKFYLLSILNFSRQKSFLFLQKFSFYLPQIQSDFSAFILHLLHQISQTFLPRFSTNNRQTSSFNSMVFKLTKFIAHISTESQWHWRIYFRINWYILVKSACHLRSATTQKSLLKYSLRKGKYLLWKEIWQKKSIFVLHHKNRLHSRHSR